jgi:phosphoserine phosphatase
MEVLSSVEVIERVRAAVVPGEEAVVAFDGDGTLWSGDVGDDLWAGFRAHGEVRDAALAAMRDEARAAGLADDGPAHAIARRIQEAYEAHRFPEERMYELVTWCFAGCTRADVRAFARDVLAARGHRATLHPEATACLAWARACALRVLVVSASPRDIVEEAVASLGIGARDVLASTAAYDGEGDAAVMRATVERPIPYGAGKPRAICGAIGGAALVAAFGDNAFDVAMLAEARVPVAVRPKDRLRARAAEVPALVELAPA